MSKSVFKLKLDFKFYMEQRYYFKKNILENNFLSR